MPSANKSSWACPAKISVDMTVHEFLKKKEEEFMKVPSIITVLCSSKRKASSVLWLEIKADKG